VAISESPPAVRREPSEYSDLDVLKIEGAEGRTNPARNCNSGAFTAPFDEGFGRSNFMSGDAMLEVTSPVNHL
jgi:hypothetical protein